MTIEEAINWLDITRREKLIKDLESVDGVDVVDIAISKIYEACEVACSVMSEYADDRR